MSKSADLEQRPTVIDLTKSPQPSNFQPNTGAKKLLIKNLRTKDRSKELDAYYARTWNELDAALTAIFHGQPPAVALEILYRGVEATCRRGRAADLFAHFRSRCKTYLEKDLLPVVESEAGIGTVEALRTVHKFWTRWDEQSVMFFFRLPPLTPPPPPTPLTPPRTN